MLLTVVTAVGAAGVPGGSLPLLMGVLATFGVPPENLVTQGYGERFLKIRTDGPEQENRRVTIRRVTPLVRPVAQR